MVEEGEGATDMAGKGGSRGKSGRGGGASPRAAQAGTGQPSRRKAAAGMPGIRYLTGPPATSLLGFLSIVGLLRALEESRGTTDGRRFWEGTDRDCLEGGTPWNPRLSWGHGLVPSLHTHAAFGRERVAPAAVSGIESIGKRLRFPGPNVGVEIDEFAAWQRDMDPEAVTAVGSDACAKKNDRNKADSTPLCMMFGAGHQKFLDRLERATAIDDSNRDGAIGEVDAALFAPWSYEDTLPKIAFRWDPTEYHPHALQAASPNKDDIRTVNGANRLAAVGLAIFECGPGRGGRLETVACVPRRNRLVDVLWPIWRDPLPLASVRTAMRLPEIREVGRLAAGDAIDVDGGRTGAAPASTTGRPAALSRALARLRVRGITGVMRATLFWDGKYKSVRTAELVA